jgi:hypothetical protein
MSDTVLRFNVETGKDFFHVYDKTGKYSKKNKCGWGSPNHDISEAKDAKVRVYLPGEEEFTEVNVFPYLPNTDCIGMEIVPADLGLEEFPPGVYKFDYIVEFLEGIVLAQTCYTFHYFPLECCISKKKMETNLNDASSEKALKVLELEALLKNAKWCACSGKMDCAQDISDYIWTNCGCCC